MISTFTPLANQSEENVDCAYVNSSIELRSPDKGSKAVDKHATVSEEQEPQRPLSKEEERSILVEAFTNFLGVVNLLFMPDWGCIHLRCEWIMSTGENTKPSKAFVEKHGPCGSNCYVCRKEHRDYMLPIIARGAISFLTTDAFRTAMEQTNPITFENCSEFTKTLTENSDHRKMVFGIKTVPAYSLFLSFTDTRHT